MAWNPWEIIPETNVRAVAVPDGLSLWRSAFTQSNMMRLPRFILFTAESVRPGTVPQVLLVPE